MSYIMNRRLGLALLVLLGAMVSASVHRARAQAQLGQSPTGELTS